MTRDKNKGISRLKQLTAIRRLCIYYNKNDFIFLKFCFVYYGLNKY